MNLLHVSPTPHERAAISTQKIMLCVLISLMPAAIAGCILFGGKAAAVLGVSVASAIVWEALSRLLMKRPQTIADGSAAVTGLLLGLNLPSTISLTKVCIGTFVAIVIVKQLFGGLGQNFANPAIVARIVLLISFQGAMTNWRLPLTDASASATPLLSRNASYMELLMGNTAGCIGETCAIALLLGGLYLWLRGIISCAAPIGMVGTVAVCSLIFGEDPLYQILAGGLLLGAVFMATDYVTTPLTKSGKFIFGIGCGILTFVIREWGGYPEGVSFSILLMNLLTPFIDRLTALKPFGSQKQPKKAQADA